MRFTLIWTCLLHLTFIRRGFKCVIFVTDVNNVQ